MKKICIVLTTRGNYAKFKKIISMAENDPEIELQLIVGGELLLSDRISPFFDIKATERIYFNIVGDSPIAMGKSTGLAMSEFCNFFERLKPDLVMLVGDRFETFAAASAAYLLRVPIAHLEGGEISGSLDNGFRYAISELSTTHFPCTEKAGQILKNRGFSNVHVVGSTSIDSLFDFPSTNPDTMEFKELQRMMGYNLFLLAIFHSDTSDKNNVSNEIQELIEAIDSLKIPTIWLNSNLDAGTDKIGSALKDYRDSRKPKFVHFFNGLPIEYFGHFLRNTSCIVGNSSAGIREASFLGTPNVSIGTRQLGREHGENSVFINPEREGIETLVKMQIEHGHYESDFLYGDGHASEKIMEIIKV